MYLAKSREALKIQINPQLFLSFPPTGFAQIFTALDMNAKHAPSAGVCDMSEAIPKLL